jgi:hypothetical protein
MYIIRDRFCQRWLRKLLASGIWRHVVPYKLRSIFLWNFAKLLPATDVTFHTTLAHLHYVPDAIPAAELRQSSLPIYDYLASTNVQNDAVFIQLRNEILFRDSTQLLAHEIMPGDETSSTRPFLILINEAAEETVMLIRVDQGHGLFLGRAVISNGCDTI